MATLKDVAERAGVSTATVSYVLNDRKDKVSPAMAKKVRKVAKEMNYQPNMMAKALRSSRSNLIGVIVEDIATFQGSNIIKGINQYAGAHGYHLVLYDLGLMDKIGSNYDRLFEFQDEIQNTMDIFRSAGTSGMIFVSTHERDVTELIHDERPLVYAYCYSRKDKDYMVGYDNQHIAQEVVERMIKKGHKRIGLISGTEGSIPTCQRLAGYQEALKEAGITLDPSIITSGNWSTVAGEEACRKLLAMKEKPSAIFCMNDWMAAGAMKEIKKCGYRIPEDIEVVGFDNTDVGYISEPGLTTIQIPLVEIGMKAAELAISLMEKRPAEAKYHELSCELIIRESFQD